MDPLTLIFGAALLGAGYLGGRVGRRRRQVALDHSGVMCSCEHTLGQHDKFGRCHASTRKRASAWNHRGAPVAWVYPQCTCQRYDGPPPLESLFPPPAQPADDVK